MLGRVVQVEQSPQRCAEVVKALRNPYRHPRPDRESGIVIIIIRVLVIVVVIVAFFGYGIRCTAGWSATTIDRGGFTIQVSKALKVLLLRPPSVQRARGLQALRVIRTRRLGLELTCKRLVDYVQ